MGRGGGLLSRERKWPPLSAAVAFVVVIVLISSAWAAQRALNASAQQIVDLEQSVVSQQHAIEGLVQLSKDLELGLKAQQEVIAGLEAEMARLAARVVYMPCKRTVYLTFDDGPSRNTEIILDILKRYGVKATFFVAGNSTSFGRAMYKRIIDEGHALGNHTYSHDYAKIYTSVEAYWEEHLRLEDLLFEATGTRPQIIRFPGGSNNTVSSKYGGVEIMDQLTQMVTGKGYRYIDWNLTSLDAAAVTQDAQLIIESVLSRVSTILNPIVLMHDSSSKTTTVEALPTIIEELHDLGFTFDVLSPTSYSVRFK